MEYELHLPNGITIEELCDELDLAIYTSLLTATDNTTTK